MALPRVSSLRIIRYCSPARACLFESCQGPPGHRSLSEIGGRSSSAAALADRRSAGIRDGHIIPFSLGGNTEIRNASCRDCEEREAQFSVARFFYTLELT